MPLKLKNNLASGLTTLSSLMLSDVFQHDGDTYMLLGRAVGEVGLVNTLNITRRYVTCLSENERVLALDATLEVHGALFTADDLTPEELAECRMGRKIQAIKLHRERTRLGLRESKEAVERGASRAGITFP
jgi:hypothetical protein